MKDFYKPYRLINPKEVIYFQKKFKQELAEWNQLYAQNPLDIELGFVLNFDRDFLLLKQEENPLALVDKNYLSSLKTSVFSDNSACFDAFCEDIFMDLLKQLLILDSLKLASNSTEKNEWIYPGSPALVLTFSNLECGFTLCLHPKWILANLPKVLVKAKAPNTVDKALAKQELELSIQFEPQFLSLNQLTNLQVGDVIKTSHLLDKPLFLQYEKQQIGEAKAGQFEHYKSIQVRKS